MSKHIDITAEAYGLALLEGASDVDAKAFGEFANRWFTNASMAWECWMDAREGIPSPTMTRIRS